MARASARSEGEAADAGREPAEGGHSVKAAEQLLKDMQAAADGEFRGLDGLRSDLLAEIASYRRDIEVVMELLESAI